MEKTIYNPKFALVMRGFVVKENITEEELFSIIESFYTPEFEEFEIQVWDGYNGWITI